MTNDVEIEVNQNKLGDRITFKLVRIPPGPQLDHVLVRYRQYKDSSVLPWSDSGPLGSPQVGDTITITGLDEGVMYEFFPVAVDSSSEESQPGNFLRVIPSSGGRLTRILQSIKSELSSWVPSANIQLAESYEGKFDPGEGAALVHPESVRTRRVFNTLSWISYHVRIHLVFGDRDRSERRKGIEQLVSEVKDHFEKNVSCFTSIEGFYDARAHEIEFESEVFGRVPGETAAAVIGLECIVEQS